MLKTFAYRKGTNADIFLHYSSNSPTSQKRRCVKALFGRVTTHCSDAETRRLEKAYLHRLFADIGYPLNFIKRALHHRTIPSPPDANREVNPPTWRLLPYAQSISELIARHLRPFQQFQLGTQTNTIIPEHVGACEGQTSNTETTERSVQDTML